MKPRMTLTFLTSVGTPPLPVIRHPLPDEPLVVVPPPVRAVDAIMPLINRKDGQVSQAEKRLLK